MGVVGWVTGCDGHSLLLLIVILITGLSVCVFNFKSSQVKQTLLSHIDILYIEREIALRSFKTNTSPDWGIGRVLSYSDKLRSLTDFGTKLSLVRMVLHF